MKDLIYAVIMLLLLPIGWITTVVLIKIEDVLVINLGISDYLNSIDTEGESVDMFKDAIKLFLPENIIVIWLILYLCL